MTLLRHIERTARRPKDSWHWRCVWCDTLIVAQDRYCEQKIAREGTVETIRLHKECHEAVLRDKDYDCDEELSQQGSPARGKTLAETEDQECPKRDQTPK